MAKTIAEIKQLFETGDIPTGADFVDMIDTLNDSDAIAAAVSGKADVGHTHSYQAADADLLAIGGLADGDTGLLKKTGSGTWALDTTDLTAKADTSALAAKANKANDTLTNPTITNYTETIYAPAAGSSFTMDLANGTIQQFTTNGNTTITLPTSVAGKCYTVIVAYGGAHTLTFAGGTSLLWSGGTTPTPTSVNGKVDIYTFVADGSRTYGSDAGRNF